MPVYPLFFIELYFFLDKLKAYFMHFGNVTGVEIKRDAEDQPDPTVHRHRY